MAKVKFHRATLEAESLGEDVMEKHHRHLVENGVSVRFVFSEESMKSKGKEVMGKAQKVGGLNAHLALSEEEFFCITLSEPIWMLLSTLQREALIDHELCHLWAEMDEEKDEVKLSLVAHDIEEFDAIVRRHGDWARDIKSFLAAAHENGCGQVAMDLAGV